MVCSNIKLTPAEESIELRLSRIRQLNQRDSGMDVQRKLEILADAAKYDASCASSGPETKPAPHRLDEARPVERFKPKAMQLRFGF